MMNARSLQGAGVFLALIGFSFRFTSEGIQFLVFTDYYLMISLLQMIFVIMLLFSIKVIKRKDTVILTMLFLLVSAAFIINDDGIRFLFWTKKNHTVGAGYMLLAYVLLGLNLLKRESRHSRS